MVIKTRDKRQWTLNSIYVTECDDPASPFCSVGLYLSPSPPARLLILWDFPYSFFSSFHQLSFDSWPLPNYVTPIDSTNVLMHCATQSNIIHVSQELLETMSKPIEETIIRRISGTRRSNFTISQSIEWWFSALVAYEDHLESFINFNV